MNNGTGLSNREVLHQTVALAEKFSKECAVLILKFLWVNTSLPKSPFKARLDEMIAAIEALLNRFKNVHDWAKGCAELDYEPEDSDFQNAYDLVGDIEDQSRAVLAEIVKLQEDFDRIKIDSSIDSIMVNTRKILKDLVDIYQNTYDVNRKVSF